MCFESKKLGSIASCWKKVCSVVGTKEDSSPVIGYNKFLNFMTGRSKKPKKIFVDALQKYTKVTKVDG